MNSLYLSRPVLACFDDEPPAARAGSGSSTGRPSPQGYVAQSDVNRILADDRRRHQAKIDAIQKSLAETLESKNLYGRGSEKPFPQQLEQLEAQKRTAEEQATHEKKQLEKQYQKQLADEKKEREQWEKRYKEGGVERALQDAAVSGDAYNVGVLMNQLRPWTRLAEITDEKGKGTGKFRSSGFPGPGRKRPAHDGDAHA